MEEVDILDRPAVHQIIVLDYSARTHSQALDAARQAIKHLAGQVHVRSVASEIVSAAEALTAEKELQRDRRRSIATAKRLYPVAEGEALHVAYYLVQDGTALLIQLVWYHRGTDDRGNSLFSQRSKEEWSKRLWQIPPELETIVVGQSLLLTAARSATPTDTNSGRQLPSVTPSPQAILGLFTSDDKETKRLAPVVVSGATIYLPLYPSLKLAINQLQFTVLILFDSLQVEQSKAADRWAFDEWPLIMKYQLRLHKLYNRDYTLSNRNTHEGSIQQLLGRFTEAARNILNTTIGSQAQLDNRRRGLFRTSKADDIHGKLVNLDEPQYNLLSTLHEAEKALHAGQIYLRNLEEHIRKLPNLAPPNEGAPLVTPDGAVIMLTERARHYVDQIESDVVEARQVADHLSRSVDLLRGRADALTAAYESSLARIGMLVAIVGSALGAVQILDAPVVLFLYRDLGMSQLIDSLPGMPMRQGSEGETFLLVRLIIVALVVILFAIISWIIGRLRSWNRK
jgi:hypothetical protein